MKRHLNAQGQLQDSPCARISAPFHSWQRTALNTLLTKRTRDSNLLPSVLLIGKGLNRMHNRS
uniref:Putative ovule protein n=1 Tax=Solanum chacoense TaxID=4108 RepID=A0A0V0HP98_SOLCH